MHQFANKEAEAWQRGYPGTKAGHLQLRSLKGMIMMPLLLYFLFFFLFFLLIALPLFLIITRV